MILWRINKQLTLRIVAESSGLNITYKVYSPLGLFQEGTAIDLNNCQYEITFTPNENGIWFVEFIFPDGFKLIQYIVVSQYDNSDVVNQIKKHDLKMTAFKFI